MSTSESIEVDEGYAPFLFLGAGVASGGVLLGVQHLGWGSPMPWFVAVVLWGIVAAVGSMLAYRRGLVRSLSAWLVVCAIVLALLLPFGWMEATPRT